MVGLNSNNAVVYQGVSYDITVVANQTSNAGTITLAPVVAGGLSVPWQLAVDSTNIYWTEQGTGTSDGYVKKMSIATGVITTLASGLSDPVGIAIDASYVYWTEYAQGTTNSGSVKRISISGGTIPTVLTSNISSPWGIAVDGTNVYWTEYLDSGAVMKMSKSSISSTGIVLANGLAWPMGIALDATNVYWAENPSNGGAVKKIPIAGAPSPTTLAASLNSPTYVVVDATSIYYTEYGTVDSSGNTNAASGSLKKVSLSLSSYPATPTTLASGLNYAAGIAVDSTNVYFTEFGFSIGTVKYVPLNANNATPTPVTISLPNGSTTPATGLYAPYYVAVDPADQYVYWTESNSGTIKRALTGTSGVTVPSVPAGVTATAGNAQVTVSWTASTGATSYNVYYSTSAAVSTTSNLGSISTTSPSAIVSGLTNNTTYYFIVTAVNGAGQSAASSPAASALPSAVITIPSAPTGVTATAGNAQVTLSWTASPGATSYDVYYSTSAAVSPTNYVSVFTTAATSALVSGLTNSTPYYFVVTAINSAGVSAASSPAASASPSAAAGVLAAPTGVVASPGNTKMVVSWNTVTGATSYDVYYSTSAAVSTASYIGLISTSTATTFTTVSSLSNSTTYYFIVTAVNGSSSSVASAAVSAAPLVGWTTLAPMTYAEFNPVVGAINGTLFVAGGDGGSGETSYLQYYNRSTNIWGTLASMPEGVYEMAGGGVINGVLYVAGGWPNTLPTNVLQSYNPATNSWTTLATMPTLAGCGVSGVINNELYVLNACDGNSGYRNAFYIYNPTTNSWTTLASPANAHGQGAGGVINGLFYVVGGYNAAGTIISAGEVYNPASNTWSTITALPAPQFDMASAVVNGQMYIMGGFNSSSIVVSTVYIYNPTTNTWSTGPSMNTAKGGLGPPGADVINGTIYVVGGMNSTGTPLTDVEALTP
jgi:N-acetylneuraminic acid mutarotase